MKDHIRGEKVKHRATVQNAQRTFAGAPQLSSQGKWPDGSILWVILCALGFIAGCNSQPSSHSAALALPLQRVLAITRFNKSMLDDATADHVLSQASQIISNNSCALSLTRSGDVSTFGVGTGAILTEKDYRDVCAQPGYVHVVNQLNWCDGTTDALGCSDTPGKCIVVVRWTPSLSQDPNQDEEGILWAHEYGHTKNLQHRSDPDAVMNPVLSPSHLKINQTECNAYLERSSSPAMAMVRNAAVNVEDFVHQIYIHGVPFEQARSFNSQDDVSKLAQLLRDPAQQPYWANAATTLGMSATPEASQQLVNFIGQGSGVLSPDAYRAKASAIIAMGYVLGQSGRQPALAYLQQKAYPNSWTVSWSSPFTSNPNERNLQLARSAIAALGLSGNDKAQSVLENIQPKHTLLPPMKAQYSQSVSEAIRESHEVRSVGFDKYVLTNEEHRYTGEVVETPGTTPH